MAPEAEPPAMEVEPSAGAVAEACNDIIKSVQDKRLYRRIRLANGLEALLIHDPEMSGSDGLSKEESEGEDESEWETDEEHVHKEGEKCETCVSGDEESGDEEDEEEESDGEEGKGHCGKGHKGAMTKKAGAAMCVGVGSFSDPEEAQGLAHFLEHMLFMGSAKFPDENEYDSFLQKHGGGSNAFTEVEYTCFHFDINHKFLHPALDRFAQFFIAPLAKPDAMDREVQAVDSEFEQVVQSDDCRLQQLQCSTAPPGHPFHGFFWGNRKSLSDPVAKGVDMRGELMKLYTEHYRADRMHLVLLGAEPLDELEKWVVDLFSPVREGAGPRPDFGGAARRIPLGEGGRAYRVESVREMQLLSLRWPLPCLHEHYTKKPYDYVSHLVGHEGAGSILSLLKEMGWATQISAGVGEGNMDRSTAGYVFEAHITLTLRGLEQWREVVGVVYEYIAMLRREGPQKWVFEELKAMSEMEFNYQEEEDVEEYTVRLAGNMFLHPGRHTVVGDYLYEEWEPPLVEGVLACLTPQNMRTDIVSKDFDFSGAGVKIEPWFKAKYVVESIPPEWLNKWAAPPVVDPALHMPPPNDFIPRDFSLRVDSTSSNSTPANSNSGEVETAPKVIYEDAQCKLWHKLDQTFRTPRTNAYFGITTHCAYESAKSAILTELFIKLLEDALNETIYLANVAKLESAVYVMQYRLEIKVQGFSHKLGNLVASIFKHISTLQVKDRRFEDMREELVRIYSNANMRPLKQSSYLRLLLTRKPVWPVEDKLAELQKATPEDLRAFLPRLFQQTFVEALVAGNVLEGEAVALLDSVRKALGPTQMPQDQRPRMRLIELKAGQSYLHRAGVVNSAEKNSVVEMYCQVGPPTREAFALESAKADLVEQILSEPYFDQLRTKEQLGYQVECGVRLTDGVLGFCFRVQSADHGPHYLQGRIIAFLEGFRAKLGEMSAEEYEEHREALVAERLEKDYNLLQETDRMWGQIQERRYIFDLRYQEAAATQGTELAQVVEWYDRFLMPTSSERRHLSVYVFGQGRDKAEAVASCVEIQDAASLQQECQFFPLTLT